MMVLHVIFYLYLCFFSLRRSEERDGSCAGALSFVEPLGLPGPRFTGGEGGGEGTAVDDGDDGAG